LDVALFSFWSAPQIAEKPAAALVSTTCQNNENAASKIGVPINLHINKQLLFIGQDENKPLLHVKLLTV
jgi:hypothetical protein